MTNPIDDASRWTLIQSRFETPDLLVELLNDMMREYLGADRFAEMQSHIPPPYGTLHTDSDEYRNTLERLTQGDTP